MAENQVFELQIDRSRWKNRDPRDIPVWDAVIVPFPDWDYFRTQFWKPQPIHNLPERVAFIATIADLPQMAYLHNNAHWPIVSQRMLDVLKSVGQFEHQVIPLFIIDQAIDQAADPNIDNEQNGHNIRTSHESHNFIALQLLDHLDVFDSEHSIYQYASRNPSLLTGVDQLVLNTPIKGFPPIFRVKTLPTRLFISAQAKIALEAADIRGIQYSPLNKFQLTQTDIIRPVQGNKDLRVEMSHHEFDILNDPPYNEKFFAYNYQRKLIEPIAFFLFSRGGFVEHVEIEVFQIFTPGQRIMYVLFDFLGQVSNGGFPQFFYNRNPFIHSRVSEALEAIGDEAMAQTYTAELKQYQQSNSQSKNSTFLPFFLSHQRELEGKMVDYINIHAEDFVIFKDATE